MSVKTSKNLIKTESLILFEFIWNEDLVLTVLYVQMEYWCIFGTFSAPKDNFGLLVSFFLAFQSAAFYFFRRPFTIVASGDRRRGGLKYWDEYFQNLFNRVGHKLKLMGHN